MKNQPCPKCEGRKELPNLGVIYDQAGPDEDEKAFRKCEGCRGKGTADAMVIEFNKLMSENQSMLRFIANKGLITDYMKEK